MEIIQAKPMPQTASTGSTGASAAAAIGSEAGSDDGFLSLMNCFMSDGGAEDINAPDSATAAGQGSQATSAIPDGMLSLIAPGLFSTMIIQPQQPALGDAATGAEAVSDIAAAAPAGDATLNPLNAPPQPPAPPPAPLAPRPDLPAKGLAPQPGEGEPAADDVETDQDAQPQISEEDLAKLVAEGKAKVEARQERQDMRSRQPLTQADSPKTPVAPEQAAPEQAAPEQAAPKQAAPKQAAPEQAAAAKDSSKPVTTTTVQIVREPAPVELKTSTPPDADNHLTAEAADSEAQAAPTTDTDTDKIPTADNAPGDGNARTGSDSTGQEGDTHGSRQAQQHTARIEKAIERNAAEQQAGANASRSSTSAAGIEADSRGGAALQAAPGIADDGGKPSAKERVPEGGPTFEEALAKVKPAHKEPEADGSLGVQATSHGPEETEAAERAAAPHSRGGVPHSAADQVSVQLGKAVPGKNDQMVINLKPVELGNVEVKLDFGTDGRVQASIMAERPETLEMLQKDQRTLERALNDAGLQTDPGSLSFNLKGQGQDGNQRQFAGYNQPSVGRGKGFASMDIEGPAIPNFAAPQYSASGANRSRLDIRI